MERETSLQKGFEMLTLDDFYNELYESSETFKNLSMDEQGQFVKLLYEEYKKSLTKEK